MAYHANQLLRDDMQRLLGEQQLAIASHLATDINGELNKRMTALEVTAANLGPAMFANPSTLQTYLEQQQVFMSLFNTGVLVVGPDGVAIASFPRSTNRLGVNYSDRDAVQIALREGKPAIGRVVLGKKQNAPILITAVPIFDNRGKVIGVLSAGTNLGIPNFLDEVIHGKFGKDGAYQVVAPKHNQYVVGSDQSYTLKVLPASGTNSMLDRFAQGFEGYGVTVDPDGEEQLVAAKQIPAAGWFLSVSLPTAEVFAPIHDLQQRMQLAAIILTIVAGWLTWWMLKSQLSPMLATVKALATLSSSDQPLQPLPVHKQNEVGELIGGVNRLISAVAVRNDALKARDTFTQSILNSVAAEIAVLDREGVVVAVNAPWQSFALENVKVPFKPAHGTEVGVNYLTDCHADQGLAANDACEASDGIQGVLSGRLPAFSLEYPYHSPDQYRWFSMTVTPMGPRAKEGVVVMHADITERKQGEVRLQESDERLRLALDAAGIGEWELDVVTRKTKRSRKHGEIFGQSEPFSDWSLQAFEDHVHPDDRTRVVSVFQGCIERQRDWRDEFRIVGDDQVVRWVSARGHFFQARPGQTSRMHGVVSDISAQKRVEDELRIAATAFESQDAMMITDAKGVILRVNQAFTETTGYAADEAVGETPQILQSGRYGPDFYQAMWKNISDTGAWQGEVWDRRKNGEVYPKWLTISAVKGKDGDVTHYVGTLYDISEQKNAEAAMLALNSDLQESQLRLRELAAQNEAQREDERKHIAREVHDELGQVLTALRMDISLLDMRFGALDSALVDKAADMKILVDRAIQGVRNVARNLRPIALDMGLVPAIEWLCNDFTKRTGVACDVHVRQAGIEIDEARAVVVFRIAQESLTNISRYAQASEVQVTLGYRGNELWVEVRDNGRGFDMAAQAHEKSYGLLGMRERALALGGQVSISSVPGQGTVIGVSIPIDLAVVVEGEA